MIWELVGGSPSKESLVQTIALLKIWSYNILVFKFKNNSENKYMYQTRNLDLITISIKWIFILWLNQFLIFKDQ